MRLSESDLALLRAGCADPWNEPAQELLNVLGVATADDLIVELSSMPLAIIGDITGRVWDAVNSEVIRCAEASHLSHCQ